ncbi:MAG: CoA transferase [Syntrophales bacterium]|jgi:formyl-CoA transferase|nr:CoA transferase [Syntrophales bacterium]
MARELEGIRIVEVGGAVAMPLPGVLLGSWGAEVIHVEPPGKGDNWRHVLGQGMAGWANPHPINYYWEHADRNKKSICINLASAEGQAVLHKLIASADIFVNNLRPYEMKKFNLTYEAMSKLNPKLIYANLTGYGTKGPEANAGGYDTVGFWARSGVMDLMHDADSAPNISRPCYGDSITSLSLLAGMLAALYIREKTGVAQAVEISLYNTASWVLGFDIAGCLVSGEDVVRPQRKTMGNPIRNVYPTRDGRWIMLGMTNSQTYWAGFCKAIDRPDLESDPKFVTQAARAQNAAELVKIIEEYFKARPLAELREKLNANKCIWSPAATPLEVTKDEQAIANDFFVEWDHPKYGKIKVMNNPIKLSKTKAEIACPAPELGQHTADLMKGLGFSDEEIAKLKAAGAVA